MIVRKWENRRLERHGRKQNGNKTARVSHRRYVRNCGRKPGYSPFYEKKGIIKARKKENGYRYYLEEDLFRLMVILYKRKMNVSLEEIEGYIKGENSVEYMKKHLQTRIKQEEMKIHYHQQAIAVCGLPQKIFKWQSNTVENVPGKIFR